MERVTYYPWEMRQEWREEMLDCLDDLLNYFEVPSDDWPTVTNYEDGYWYTGIIDEDLYNILLRLHHTREGITNGNTKD